MIMKEIYLSNYIFTYSIIKNEWSFYNCFSQYQMIQEQRNASSYPFIKGEYATIKIKMQPQSLILQVPLDWQINKIKCLLVKMMIKLDFDMFIFQHDNQEIPGEMTLKQLIERDSDAQCSKADHYVLTYARLQLKKQQFDKYYINKMKPLVNSLENSPFQPILHPTYYSMKYLNRINHIPYQGGRELIVNINQLQQMQNIIQEQRRQNQNVGDNILGAAWVGGGENNGGVFNMLGRGFIRFIQIISIFSIGKFLLSNSDIQVFIIMAFLCLTYFAIDHLKTKQKKLEQKGKQTTESEKNFENQEQLGFVNNLCYRFLIFSVESLCLLAESVISFLLSLFPNWTVESHREWFKDNHEQISLTLNKWKAKIAPNSLNSKENNEKGPQSSDLPKQNEQGDDLPNEQMRRQHED